MVHSDGVPDKNVPFIKTIRCCTQLDTLIVCMKAPGSSCCDEAERTLSHLNEFMNGCVFDAFQSGNALILAENTTNIDMELINFEQVMVDLGNMFNRQQRDCFQVKTGYRKPRKNKNE